MSKIFSVLINIETGLQLHVLEGSSFLNTGQTFANFQSLGKRSNTMEVLNTLARGRANSFEQSRKIFAGIPP